MASDSVDHIMPIFPVKRQVTSIKLDDLRSPSKLQRFLSALDECLTHMLPDLTA